MKSRPRRPFLNKLAIIFVPILMIGFSLFMWAWQVEPRRVETVTAAMEMPQWKRKESPPLRIAIAGDFHLRPNGGDLAHRYMETIMEARPDMIFLLGDYANGHTRESSMAPETAREYFKMLKAPLGIFAVQGNHDQYYGWNLWRNMFSGLGILPMWNDSLLLYLPGGRELQLSSVRDDYHLRIRPEELPLRFPRIFRISFFHMYPTFFPCWLPARRTSSSARIPTEARYAFPEAGPWQTSHERRSNFPIPGPS